MKEGLLKEGYVLTIASVKKFPVLLLPFTIFGLLEAGVGLVAYFASRSALAASWGDILSHYPPQFLLFHKVLALSRTGLAIVFGSLLTGMAVYMAGDAFVDKMPKVARSFKMALKKYLNFFLVVFVINASFYLVSKPLVAGVSSYFPSVHSVLLVPALHFFLAVTIQSALIYVIPLVVFENMNFIDACVKAPAILRKLLLPTVIFVAVPMLCYAPVTILKLNAPGLAGKAVPGFVFLVAALGIVVGNLVVDAPMTLSTAFLYLLYREHSL